MAEGAMELSAAKTKEKWPRAALDAQGTASSTRTS
jgi:hypothetical protein